jgi:flagellum-specific peptidoglycan hydrolase FlgJ
MSLLTREEWVKANWPAAVKATTGTGIFPETMMAMAVVESQGRVNGNWYPGQGLVAKRANNYFGIKTSSAWKGATVALPTPGDADKISTFRVYPNFEASVADFIKFLQVNPRYTNAGVFQAQNYVEQIVAIARAGYAESPSYTTIVTSVANKVKYYVKNIILPTTTDAKKYLPLLVAGLIIAGLFVSKKLQS